MVRPGLGLDFHLSGASEGEAAGRGKLRGGGHPKVTVTPATEGFNHWIVLQEHLQQTFCCGENHWKVHDLTEIH